MTFLEMKTKLKNETYGHCKTPKDYQNELEKYIKETFHEDKVDIVNKKLISLARSTYMFNRLKLTPDSLSEFLNDLDSFVKENKCNISEDFNPAQFVLMTMIYAENQ